MLLKQTRSNLTYPMDRLNPIWHCMIFWTQKISIRRLNSFLYAHVFLCIRKEIQVYPLLSSVFVLEKVQPV